MTIRECITQAQRKLGIPESEIADNLDYSDSRSTETTISLTNIPVPSEIEQEFIDAYVSLACAPNIRDNNLLKHLDGLIAKCIEAYKNPDQGS